VVELLPLLLVSDDALWLPGGGGGGGALPKSFSRVAFRSARLVVELLLASVALVAELLPLLLVSDDALWLPDGGGGGGGALPKSFSRVAFRSARLVLELLLASVALVAESVLELALVLELLLVPEAVPLRLAKICSSRAFTSTPPV
jgi:hypothetical protein